MVKIIDDDIAGQNKSNQPDSEEKAAQDLGGRFVKAILALPPQHIELIVKKLMPAIASYELRQPRVWGEVDRVNLHKKAYVNDLLINTRSGTVTIEEDAFFSHRCQLLTGTHNYRKKGKERLTDVPKEGRDIHVKKGVWMGSGVIVLGPCVIGENAVIASGSVVTADEIPPNTIWAGHPAEQVKGIDFED